MESLDALLKVLEGELAIVTFSDTNFYGKTTYPEAPTPQPWWKPGVGWKNVQ